MKLVLAHEALEEKLIMAFGTVNVDVPNLMVPFTTVTVKLEVGSVPCSLKWLLNQTISLAFWLLSWRL
jgi:hypothetical protein